MASLFSFLSPIVRGSPALALDVSDTSAQIIEVARGPLAEVRSFVRRDLPPGIMEDGRILDQAALADALRQAVESAPQKPRTANVIAELPESQTLIHHFSVGRDVGVKDLPEYLLARAGETLPVNLNEYAWDYQILSKKGESYEIVFAAAPADVVVAYEHTLTLAGLKLAILELESAALARAVVKPESVSGESAAAVIDVGGRTTTFAFADKAGLQLSVSLPVAGDAFTAAIAKKLKMKTDAAEERKRKEGFRNKDAAEALREAIAPLADEYARAAGWYERTKGRKVGRAFLAGGSSALPGFLEELAARLGVPIEFGRPPFKVAGLEPHQIAVVSGLAMRAKKLSPGMNFVVPS